MHHSLPEGAGIRPDSPRRPAIWYALLSKGHDGAIVVTWRACFVAESGEAQYNLASAFLRKGRTDEAIDHYRKRSNYVPENATRTRNLGSAFLAKDRIQDAITHTEMLSRSPRKWLHKAIWRGC